MPALKKPADSKAPVFGRWQAIRPIGRGGFGATIEVKHLDTNKFAIVKIISSDHYGEDFHDYVRRFKREIEFLSELDHPNICRLYEANFDTATPWFAMERYKGNTVDEELEQYGPAPEKIWFDRARDILQALEYAHSKKISHGDLNPANVIIDGRGAKLIDFGIARKDGSFTSNSTKIFGANGWTSPEFGALKPGVEDDIFVAASLLVKLGTGNHAFKANTVNNYQPSITNDEPNYKGLSSNQIQLLRKMHEKSRSNRCSASTALSLIDRLEPSASSRSIVPQAKNVPTIKRTIKQKPSALNDAAVQNGAKSTYKYKGLTIASILMGGVPLVAYWIISKLKRTKEFEYPIKFPLSISALANIFSFGMLAPITTFWWGRKFGFTDLKRQLILQFIFGLLTLIGTVAESGQQPSSALSFLRLLGICLGIFGYRKIVDLLVRGSSKPNAELVKSVQASSQLESHLTWHEVEKSFLQGLVNKRGKRFIFEIESAVYKDIYFQGYSEPDASRTIEAAADLSVRPKLSDKQKLGMSVIGWDLPSEDLPNFIMFLDTDESDDRALAAIFARTLREGYGIELGTFRVIAPIR